MKSTVFAWEDGAIWAEGDEADQGFAGAVSGARPRYRAAGLGHRWESDFWGTLMAPESKDCPTAPSQGAAAAASHVSARTAFGEGLVFRGAICAERSPTHGQLLPPHPR